jgi:MscS family membrane protein
MNFLKCMERSDLQTAERYLQPASRSDRSLGLRIQQLKALHGRFQGSIALLSDDPKGSMDPTLPAGHERIGMLAVGNTSVDIILARVEDPTAGKIWLLSKETVAQIPILYAEQQRQGATLEDRFAPAALSGRQVLGMSLTKWLAWLLSIPLAWLLAWLLEFLLSAPVWIGARLKHLPFRSIWVTRIGMPLRCILAILIHGLFVYRLGPPLLYRVYYGRFIATLLMACVLWLVSRLTDRGFERAVQITRSQKTGGESILLLLQRLMHIALLIVAFVGTLALFGFNVRTMLAGLGIGGLAIALAAQKTLENLIGGVTLLMDKAVQVGDFCRIGDRLGTVEDVGLRSLKLRTLDQNLLVVPNGTLAQMSFENMTHRPKLLINPTFDLRIETETEQLRFVLDRAQKMLDGHPAIEAGSSRVRVANFEGASFAVELFAYATTGDWAQFTAIRQDVLLKIAEIVQASGARFAAPTRLTYLSRDKGLDAQKAEDIVRKVTDLRARDAFRFPGEARAASE